MDTTREHVLEALRSAKAQLLRDLEQHNGLNPPEIHLRTFIAHVTGRLDPSEPAIAAELWAALESIHKAGF